MNAFSRIWEKLRNRQYREAFVASQLKRGVPNQIRKLLRDRGWTQAELADRAGLKQGAVSRAADPDYGNLTINTILRIAAGLDVAYVGRFVPFSELARWYANMSESALGAADFETEDREILRSGETTETLQFSFRQSPSTAATDECMPPGSKSVPSYRQLFLSAPRQVIISDHSPVISISTSPKWKWTGEKNQTANSIEIPVTPKMPVNRVRVEHAHGRTTVNAI